MKRSFKPETGKRMFGVGGVFSGETIAAVTKAAPARPGIDLPFDVAGYRTEARGRAGA